MRTARDLERVAVVVGKEVGSSEPPRVHQGRLGRDAEVGQERHCQA
ncbi:MAG: hypothetical protein ABI193_26585 [Minicystis sp.]